MFDNVATDELVQMAKRAGYRVAREYPGIEAEDIAYEALTRLYERAERLKAATADYLYRVLEGEGVKYAAKERYDYILFSSQYVYTPREVRAVLEHVYYDPTARDVPTQKDDWLSAEIGKGTVGISLVDVDVAMEKIKPEYRKVLERRFLHGDTVTDTKAVTRAVDSLTQVVNRLVYRKGLSDDGPGSRTAMSNAKAQYVTRAESGHETNAYEPDAVRKLQTERSQERSDPPGTHFNWSKYTD
ncbi:sigma-70 family RNA polymerase sigma factor [Actinomadura sp. WMMB 499]|uniref:sigma-70 family RNA polymerase sigma factor n=1 Tax=Actinomadura sp. WMMB 499 TaxID=1219491 RepID=UPI001246B74B|nr:sigma-70 family RNA polymerase sigma factor [Actinomadura sp. WMMB 499]QFG25468.1 sigma-70 family RNA polymerase sigma factor [Actinomadura sp. WMMB 499]